MSNNRLKNRIALVTGASRGIGRAVALAFAKEGAHVIAMARRSGALEELDDDIQALGGTATLLRLNLTDGDKIDGLGPTILERFGQLDVLVGNAGILGPLSPLGHVSEKDWNEVLNVNLTANWRLIRTLDPLLRKSDAGRAIFVTSGAAQNCRAYWGPYSVSKAALEALVKTYAAEVNDTNVRANLINPGAVATAMRAKAMPGEDPASLPKPEDLVETFIRLALPDFTDNGTVVQYR
jgi:NAD(P)-dependent dehydrogenase (short-subunit alcohol dehydrogenase family)